MIAISLSNLTLILGARAIFRELNWEIQHDQKVGLIGPNGAGKSSIFKLIVGEYTPEPGGAIVRVKGVSVGYLSQQPEFDPACTAYGLALAGNPRYAEVETELARLESLLSLPSVYNDPNALTRTLEQQQKALGEFEAMGGAGYPKRVREILLGLGLPEADLEKPIGLLSG
ncbi:MAG TPA: ATP-binding cassette domain-containing protein, partial [Anaerolineales bacterium]|nr:ATP-binding cassette domain-containing protein [Anaerolineales bacterium]